MTNQHPITPPLELVHRWADMLSSRSDHAVFSLAAQWGADMELEACAEWLEQNCEQWIMPYSLRAARRPKPPSLKEQALTELGYVYDKGEIDDTTFDIIRKALKALPND